jgi:hypothetical protein
LSNFARLNWRYALRIALITLAFHAACLLIVSTIAIVVPYLREIYAFEMAVVLIRALVRQYAIGLSLKVMTSAIIFMFAYWAVFVLAALSDERDPVQRWRIWLSWLLMTLPFVAIYSYSLYLINDLPLYLLSTAYPLTLSGLSPLVTFIVVVADYFVRQISGWRHSR